MKRLLPILLLGLFSLFCGQVAAQNRALDFESQRHDFGIIAEDGGEVCCTFLFENRCDKPVVILSVSGGCSCTTAQFSREPILPGRGGEIVVAFDPMHQPTGAFMRKVVVVTSAGNIPLTISGEITPRKMSIDEQYSLQLGGGVRVEANSHAFGYVEHGVAVRSSIGVINNSVNAVEIAITPVESSSALDIRYPKSLAAGESGVIDFGYDIAVGADVYGTLSDVLAVDIDGKRSRYNLIIGGVAIDRRENLSNKEWQKIQLSENFIKFGTLKHTSKEVVRELEVLNVGFEPLIIRKIECNNTLFKITAVGKTTIPQDGKSALAVSFDPSKSNFGAAVARVTIISNDPQQPAISFKVSAIVEN